MGTTHASGPLDVDSITTLKYLNLKIHSSYSATGPSSTGTWSIPGLAVDDKVLAVTMFHPAATVSANNPAATAYTISAASTMKLAGTQTGSAFVIQTMYLDVSA